MSNHHIGDQVRAVLRSRNPLPAQPQRLENIDDHTVDNPALERKRQAGREHLNSVAPVTQYPPYHFRLPSPLSRNTDLPGKASRPDHENVRIQNSRTDDLESRILLDQPFSGIRAHHGHIEQIRTERPFGGVRTAVLHGISLKLPIGYLGIRESQILHYAVNDQPSRIIRGAYSEGRTIPPFKTDRTPSHHDRHEQCEGDNPRNATLHQRPA
ncbi:MAG: hypothetical protein HPY84_14170 [Syntrophobacteraceae bacterium]|nr:hypothetical protein [Syntrophobacteraceae bacterium]